MKTYHALPFLLPLAAPAVAQDLLDEWCTGGLDGYGQAVAYAGVIDPSGQTRVIIGAPGLPIPGGSSTGYATVPGKFTVVGAADGDRLGAAVEGDLDLDGDGRAELLAGSPGRDVNGTDSGSVQVINGNGNTIYEIHGDAAGDEFGSSLVALGDLDADGRDDFLVGAPGGSYVRVVSGATGSTLRTHLGASASEGFGWSVTKLDDVDGDGRNDYAVGAPFALGVGRVQIFSAADGSPLSEIEGLEPGAEFGYAISSGADVDRDGRSELFVGSPEAGGQSGRVQGFRVPDGGLVWFSDGEAGERHGAGLAALRDFDGDGYGDVAIGAPGSLGTFGANDPGRTIVLSGFDRKLLVQYGGSFFAGVGWSMSTGDLDADGLSDVIAGAFYQTDGYTQSPCVVAIGRSLDRRTSRGADGERLGMSLARVGDMNGDGRPELLMGDPEASDAQGIATGKARVETPEGVLLFEVFGDSLDDRLGEGVADVGDVDGDGVMDWAVGAARRKTFQSGGGYARVYSGADGSVLHTFFGSGDPSFGSVLTGGRDLDADGHADILVGGCGFQNCNFGGIFSPICSFRDGGLVRAYSGATGEILYEITGGDALGASLAMLRDVDGDGHDDFVVGTPEVFVGAPAFSLGRVELRSGADGTVLGSYSSFDHRDGTALETIDDLDGDGLEDFLVSTWDPDGTIGTTSVGTVRAVSSATLEPLWTVSGFPMPYQGLVFGYALEAGPSGSDTFVLGRPGLISQSATALGGLELRNLSDGSLVRSVGGYSGWDYLGYSVAHLGDVDGDGQADFAGGAPTEPFNTTGSQVGQSRVEVVLSARLRAIRYCPRSVNSTGVATALHAEGSSRVSLNDCTLIAEDLPPNQFGVFVAGPDALQVPFLGGWRCVGPITRLSPPLPTQAAQAVTWSLDLSAPPAKVITAGSTWNFQFWYRDLAVSANTSDALSIEFTP